MSATSRPRRAKKVVAATIGLAVVFAGIAYAFFSSQEAYSNGVKGGDLKVTADLPLDFGDQTLYPTSATQPDTAIIDSFTISNENPVTAGYSIFATDRSTTPDGAAQFQNLYIKITSTSTTTETDQAIPGASTPLDDSTTTPHTTVYYSGKLADLDQDSTALLGTLAKNADRTYDVAVWLADTDTEQPQGVPTNFDLTLAARTPGSTATQSSSTQS